MPNRSKGIVDIRQILHRLRAGDSQRRIAQELHINWRTVKKYALWAKAQGLLSGELPPPDELQRLLNATFTEPPPPQNTSSVAPYREQIVQLRRELAALQVTETGTSCALELAQLNLEMAELELEKLT